MTRALAAAAACLQLALPALAADHALPLWRIDGDANRVWLLGSVHYLRESDYPLPAEIDAAYRDAETLIMEIDLDDLDPSAAAGLALALGTAGEAGLPALLGPDAYARAERLAHAASVPLDSLLRFEPWLAALNVEQLLLARAGYDPAHGVENWLVGRAAADGKEILGLETIERQFGLLDALPADAQRLLLLDTLADAPAFPETMSELVDAWRSGDLGRLERTLLEDMRQQPALYTALVAERNRSWLPRIVGLLDERDDYLVVVGALHLAGRDGLPELLTASGHAPVQVERALRD